ncbi:MAG: hypothetical protein COT81_02475 [Candidatus Buchananbacteria bacterium CG10_big_fil_rev_8_21_14_0_10_42_9]|uniref:Uncharacterized protein n=1 Tax=Candidatus Buchananbacteria bacterium CG10_big_fil_rev_8_21_14_0_10_42_9 TaxID=1974526 RepID=A0A2H0W3R5_9BACT|nr:MAG: hypothetical protein COT81_02475 [Candidatus Buchananbacteria bacterium CG10_big_fil_rev_8_21_14_0_10_42_9]
MIKAVLEVGSVVVFQGGRRLRVRQIEKGGGDEVFLHFETLDGLYANGDMKRCKKQRNGKIKVPGATSVEF